MAAPQVRYAAVAASERITVALEGFVLLYDRRSGMTHILASPAPELLDALSSGAGDAADLVARLGGIEAEGDPLEVIAARLSELEAIGLVRRA